MLSHRTDGQRWPTTTCDECRWLGRYAEYDIWRCRSLITLRWGNDDQIVSLYTESYDGGVRLERTSLELAMTRSAHFNNAVRAALIALRTHDYVGNPLPNPFEKGDPYVGDALERL